MAHSTWVDVTPYLAASWLDHNSRNRKITWSLVKLYAQDMIEGRWITSAETIAFDTNGVMVDGQHRCHAVIESGVTCRFLVVNGVDPASRDVVDMGRVRTAGDVLGMAGITNANGVAATARLVLMYDLHRDRTWGAAPLSKPTVIHFAQQHEADLESATSVGRTMTNEKIGMSRSAAGALLYLIGRDSSLNDGTLLDDFVKGVATGLELHSGDPRHALRRTSLSALSGAWRTQSMMAIGIKAWNGWAEDRPVQVLRFRRDELPMPKVK